MVQIDGYKWTMSRMDEFLTFLCEDQHGVHQKFGSSSSGHSWIDIQKTEEKGSLKSGD